MDVEELQQKIPQRLQNDFEKLKKKIEKYLKQLRNELKYIEAPELPFHFFKNNTIIKGRVDSLIKNRTGDYTIVELKTGSKKSDLLSTAKDQIELYALALTRYRITKGIVYFFGDGYKKEFSIDNKEMNLKLFQTIKEIITMNLVLILKEKHAKTVYSLNIISVLITKIKTKIFILMKTRKKTIKAITQIVCSSVLKNSPLILRTPPSINQFLDEVETIYPKDELPQFFKKELKHN
jgi:hypothetical protein